MAPVTESVWEGLYRSIFIQFEMIFNKCKKGVEAETLACLVINPAKDSFRLKTREPKNGLHRTEKIIL
ncbi:hypothetical protein [Methanosarcina sp.]|uniref:hypothetical protein n=1 Tax=Methanosarcina sp. TaxID=2213 RepID=UPI002D1AD2FB|nr:hypothetical protein [Methanosarcina sp.]HOW14367.1 hypothetical protein [Methanosarcina sp.]